MQLTQKNFTSLNAGQRVTLDSPVDDNMTAHLILSPKGEERTLIRGYLTSLNPKTRITSVKEKTKTSISYESLPYDVRDLKNALIKSYKQLNKPTARLRAIRPDTLAAQVMAIPDIKNPDNFRKYVPRGWGKNTASTAVSYFARTFGHFYQTSGFEATEADYLQFFENEIDRIYDTHFQRPCKNGIIVKQRRENIYNDLISRWRNARIVQLYLLENHPEFEWPATLIPLEPRYKSASTEETKTISYRQYITVLTLLKRLCMAEVPYSYAAHLEAVCGARIGESCAPYIKEFEITSDYGRYYVEFQIDKNGNRTNVLKNKYSYRFVFYMDFLKEMIDLRKNQLVNAGFSADEIPNFPYASSSNNPHSFLSKQKVSAFLKEVLILAGCDEEWIKQESDRLFITSKATGNEEDLEVTAHLLRRTIATFLANGGIPIEVVDAILGHENEANKTEDYASEDKAREVCAMIDRAIYLGSLCKSSNPAFSPVNISTNTSANLHGNTAYSFVIQEDTYASINIACLEAGHAIRITAADNSPQLALFADSLLDKNNLLSPRDTIENNHSRPILPALPSPAEVERWIFEANQIDLTEIITKWRQ